MHNGGYSPAFSGFVRGFRMLGSASWTRKKMLHVRSKQCGKRFTPRDLSTGPVANPSFGLGRETSSQQLPE